ncbi:hypothetical protein ACJ51O_37180 (plasmid) [Burkholderia pyrrocinia]|uniref:hypothetical protein n=1 Tax=Burkholderia pyrrocinia TaxID=60550 RepID=UPI0038B47C36
MSHPPAPRPSAVIDVASLSQLMAGFTGEMIARIAPVLARFPVVDLASLNELRCAIAEVRDECSDIPVLVDEFFEGVSLALAREEQRLRITVGKH